MAKIDFKCPKCRHAITAELNNVYKFVIYKCPKCDSNVVFYDNKIDVISDKMINKIKKNKKLKLCGIAETKKSEKITKEAAITSDKINDLKILLETEKDVGSFLAKLS